MREAAHVAGLAQDIRADIADIDEINRVSALRMAAMGYLLEKATGKPLPKGFDSAPWADRDRALARLRRR